MKKITFPHMGELDISLKTFLQELGFEVVVPPVISKKTLDLGMKYGPEFACLPLKINLGNFIEALEEGANTIIMGGGCGPCRFGYYGEVQREILQDLGYDFEMFIIEPNLIEDYRNLKRIFGGIPLKRFFQALTITWKKLLAIDRVYKLVLQKRATESEEGQVDRLYNRFLIEIDPVTSIRKIEELTKEYLHELQNVGDTYKRGVEIRIGIVGEIYLVLEPFVNLEIEKKLGELGAAVQRDIYISSWLYHFLHLSNDFKRVKEAASKYLKNFVGGHGLESVGNTVRYAREGFDGVIQLAPFTCMPEIISQTILPEISQREKIPVLSLFFDEHSADAGLRTRLEAFVDLLVRKKKYKEGVNYG